LSGSSDVLIVASPIPTEPSLSGRTGHFQLGRT
jgi:hypothetical protein